MVNVILGTVLSFMANELSSVLNFVFVSYTNLGVLFGIGMAAAVVTVGFNSWVISLKMYKQIGGRGKVEGEE